MHDPNQHFLPTNLGPTSGSRSRPRFCCCRLRSDRITNICPPTALVQTPDPRQNDQQRNFPPYSAFPPKDPPPTKSGMPFVHCPSISA
ncbi:hypothetical protein B0T16DRAFT_423659 [Cercophora newfieldiana]|uniref:Uncharacterized protein n=1 Tax=Cercophora newfieldiana TaxID=92897 RepID=A0AA40CIL5_9PEZI|nr:hypothetical protein B0T16DRAFT_423659 [Cercophora newfieldiana]